MEAVESKKRAGRNRQLTERDRELCGFLAVCRYLTREQIEKLIFPGRSKARSSTRLRQLASRIGGQAAVVRGDLGYASAEGWTTVWAVTAEGFELGSQLLNLKLARTPKHDVGPWFLKHEVTLNEVFLGLVPQDGRRPRGCRGASAGFWASTSIFRSMTSRRIGAASRAAVCSPMRSSRILRASDATSSSTRRAVRPSARTGVGARRLLPSCRSMAEARESRSGNSVGFLGMEAVATRPCGLHGVPRYHASRSER